MKPPTPFRPVPLGLQLCRFLFATGESKTLPVPGKPWVALVCDSKSERFYSLDFCADEPGPADFEKLLLRTFARVDAKPEFIEVDDTDVAIDIGPFCTALDIRIEVRDHLEIAAEKIVTIRNGVVADVEPRDDPDDPSDSET